MPSVRKRCLNGTRKDKTGRCVTSVRLAPDDISKIIEKHALKPTASKMLKKLRLKKWTKNKTYMYKSAFDDKTNMMRQADAVVAHVLKHGPSPLRRTLRSPMAKRMTSKGSPLKGTTF